MTLWRYVFATDFDSYPIQYTNIKHSHQIYQYLTSCETCHSITNKLRFFVNHFQSKLFH